jgi:hypothetical protein
MWFHVLESRSSRCSAAGGSKEEGDAFAAKSGISTSKNPLGSGLTVVRGSSATAPSKDAEELVGPIPISDVHHDELSVLIFHEFLWDLS